MTEYSVTIPVEPVSVTLTARQIQRNCWRANGAARSGFGFQVEEFGPNTFQVRAMPALFR
jgi:DNA mismatch repair ATPase MutL